MRALEYRFSPALWLGARTLGARVPALAGRLSGVRLRDAPPPAPPNGEWVPVGVRMAGICGTDVAMLRARTGPQLSPFVSFPAVPGHEVLGVALAGPLAGRRVVLDPLLGCRARSLEPCKACAEGRPALCEHVSRGPLSPGLMLGYCRDLPGGWAERVVAPAAQLHPVPDAVSDEAAALAEPLAVALHAVLAHRPAAGERVLVLGAGTIGLCTLAAIRLLEGAADVTVVGRHVRQRELAERLGATRLVGDVREAERQAETAGWGRAHPGLLGVRGWTGGFDRVYDAVGSARTLAGALRLCRAGGEVTLLGCSGVLPRLDLTNLWLHEVRLSGSYVYGPEPAAAGEHTIALALRLLAARPDIPLGALVTHRFGLRGYRQALETAFFHRRSGSVKVVFTPEGSG